MKTLRSIYTFLIWFRPFAVYALIAWLFTILAVSSIPSLNTPKIHTGLGDIRLDYLIHFCEYGLLAALSYLSVAGPSFKIRAGRFILITCCLLLFAVADEFHQKLIPGRYFSYKDITANLTGILVSSAVTALILNGVRSVTGGKRKR